VEVDGGAGRLEPGASWSPVAGIPLALASAVVAVLIRAVGDPSPATRQ
jgi:hypothetical protein